MADATPPPAPLDRPAALRALADLAARIDAALAAGRAVAVVERAFPTGGATTSFLFGRPPAADPGAGVPVGRIVCPRCGVALPEGVRGCPDCASLFDVADWRGRTVAEIRGEGERARAGSDAADGRGARRADGGLPAVGDIDADTA